MEIIKLIEQYQKEDFPISPLWKETETYLHKNCSEECHEKIRDYLTELVQSHEAKAFEAGIVAAFNLTFEVLQKGGK